MTESIRCKYCNCGLSKVTKTVHYTVRWRGKKRVHVKRTRKCNNCGLSYNTIELPEDPVNKGFPEEEDIQ